MILTYARTPGRAYVLVSAAVVLCVLSLSLPASAHLLWDARYLMLAFCALTLGTRLYFKVPRAAAAVPLSASFVLLAALLYGFAAATPLAAAAAAVSSFRLSRRGGLILSDAAPAAAATFIAGSAAQYFGFAPPTAAPFAAALAACLFSSAHAAAAPARLFAYGHKAAGRSSSRAAAGALAWTLTAYLFASSLAVLAAQVPAGLPLDTLIALLAAAGACVTLYGARRAGDGRQQPAWMQRGEGAQFVGTNPFCAAFEYAAIGMAVLSSKGRLLWVNRSLCAFLGYAESELMYSSLSAITHKDDLAPVLAALKSMLRERTDLLQMEVRHQRRGGEQVWALWNVARFEDAQDDETYVVLQLQDITEREQSEQRLLHAFHDPLTGLPNRALFADHVKLTIARAKRGGLRRFAVLFCDLDRFKIINDSLGHVAGDQLLVEVARRLESCLRQGDTVARVGGDEFTILLDDLADDAEAVAVAERVQKEVSAPISLSGRDVFTTMSIGLATGAVSYSDPEDLLRDADTAMYRAKSLGKARHVVFDHSMHASAVNLLQIETDLRKALERGQFYLLYQPIVSLGSFKLCGFEALLRWHPPERGLISPLDFIPIAEETGQIIGIGEWALHEACRQMREWQEKFPQASPIFMSVNLSAKQFNHPTP